MDQPIPQEFSGINGLSPAKWIGVEYGLDEGEEGRGRGEVGSFPLKG